MSFVLGSSLLLKSNGGIGILYLETSFMKGQFLYKCLSFFRCSSVSNGILFVLNMPLVLKGKACAGLSHKNGKIVAILPFSRMMSHLTDVSALK